MSIVKNLYLLLFFMTLGLNSAEQIRYDNVMPDRFGNPILDYNRVVKVNPDLILKLPDSTRLLNLNVEASGGDVEPLSGGYTFNDLVLDKDNSVINISRVNKGQMEQYYDESLLNSALGADWRRRDPATRSSISNRLNFVIYAPSGKVDQDTVAVIGQRNIQELNQLLSFLRDVKNCGCVDEQTLSGFKVQDPFLKDIQNYIKLVNYYVRIQLALGQRNNEAAARFIHKFERETVDLLQRNQSLPKTFRAMLELLLAGHYSQKEEYENAAIYAENAIEHGVPEQFNEQARRILERARERLRPSAQPAGPAIPADSVQQIIAECLARS